MRNYSIPPGLGLFVLLVCLVVPACKRESKATAETRATEQTPASAFPRTTFGSVRFISQDRLVGDPDTLPDDAVLRKQFHYIADVHGYGFVNEQGLPLHNRYKEQTLSAAQIQKLMRLLRPAGSTSEGDKACLAHFRDVIVFYNQDNRPVAHIQLCFDCELSYFSPVAPYMANFDNENRFSGLNALFNEVIGSDYRE